jgi:hypothetical protein
MTARIFESVFAKAAAARTASFTLHHHHGGGLRSDPAA